jgi:hypothetical protein
VPADVQLLHIKGRVAPSPAPTTTKAPTPPTPPAKPTAVKAKPLFTG